MSVAYGQHPGSTNYFPGDLDEKAALHNQKTGAITSDFSPSSIGSGRILSGNDNRAEAEHLHDADFGIGGRMSGRFDKVFGNAAFESDLSSMAGSQPGVVLKNNLLGKAGSLRETDQQLPRSPCARTEAAAVVGSPIGPSIMNMFRRGNHEHAETNDEGQSRTPVMAFSTAEPEEPSAVPSTRAQVKTVAAWEVELKQLVAAKMQGEAFHRAAPSQGMVKCHIKRVKNYFGTHCSFQMHLDSGDVFLLAARRRKKSKVSSYVISQDVEDLKRDTPNCIAKLKSNFVGTEYVLWGKTSDPAIKKGYAAEQVCIDFQQAKLLTTGSPRTMYVALPAPESGWQPSAADGSDSISQCLQLAQHRELPPYMERKMAMLTTKRPEYDDSLKGFVLDFKGRVKEASVKNFQLVAWDHNSDQQGSQVLMQFGKLDNDTFTLDFAYPMSVHTAFAIALASIDTKLCYTVG